MLKRFFWKTLCAGFLIAASFVCVNVYVDEFGLFRDVKNRSIPILVSERAAKYLLSLRYVPVNFEGILIGPSLSDQLNTKNIHALKVYNLSLLGANTSELRILADNALTRGNLKALVICLDPFVTRESGINDARMRPQMYWSVLGSTFTFKYYNEKTKACLNPQRQKFTYNDYGAANIVASVDVPAAIRNYAETVRRQPDQQLFVDPKALADLREIISRARQKKVKIFAFYFPVPYEVYSACEKRYKGYQARMNALFDDHDVVWDFNDDAYLAFRKDYRNYSDHGHISERGADFLLKELDSKLKAFPDGVVSSRSR